jgi:hypothetical protein
LWDLFWLTRFVLLSLFLLLDHQHIDTPLNAQPEDLWHSIFLLHPKHINQFRETMAEQVPSYLEAQKERILNKVFFVDELGQLSVYTTRSNPRHWKPLKACKDFILLVFCY